MPHNVAGATSIARSGAFGAGSGGVSSSYSNEQEATVKLPTPTNVTAENDEEDTNLIHVTWEAPAAYEALYDGFTIKVYRADDYQ